MTTPHPSGDERYAAIDLTMKRFKYEKDALLEVLNAAQETFGYLSEDLLIYISQQLHLPLIRVYGVATFYHMFTFEPLGEHNAIVCTGTVCHVKGSDQIVKTIAEAFKIESGETTPDGFLSLTAARCIGSCGLAPVAVLDGKVMGKETPQGMLRRIEEMVSMSRRKQPVGSQS
ncbi:bidirectional hydrogenase complex protein HoxE [Candidatus Leptofilum sp.]|uniref:bidirectional hydrogenase complex protein HoxE n=1 Tax=Candidatus Leptofilum sp. TaxID=3241576 RepID=UPI003B5BDFEA